jgi:hypothetical protein
VGKEVIEKSNCLLARSFCRNIKMIIVKSLDCNVALYGCEK